MRKTLTLTAEGDIEVRDLLRKHISSTQIKHLKERGDILCNGEPVRARFRLKKGDRLLLVFPEEKEQEYIAKHLDIEICYADEDYLIVDKGVGISCIPNKRGMNHIFEGLAEYFPDGSFHVLTRLDKDTSGLVVLARSSLAASAAPRIEKRYLALVEGEISEGITIDAPIARGDDIQRVVSPQGKPSVTKVKPLRFSGDRTLIECEPVTGRTHQIRLHLAYIGHPLVGDTLYGNGIGEYNGGQKLLCHRVTFIQPFTKQLISVVSQRKL